jgi:septum formation protein
LLAAAGYRFDVVPSSVAEPDPSGFPSPEAYVAYVAWLKANDVGRWANRWVLAADTVVAYGDLILGKATDRADAQQMLGTLRGTRHRVVTGVCLWIPRSDAAVVAVDSTTVLMRRLSDQQLTEYLDSGLWEGKAGAYGIQDRADPFVEALEGSFTNVVGLPIERVKDLLDWAWRAEQLDTQTR